VLDHSGRPDRTNGGLLNIEPGVVVIAGFAEDGDIGYRITNAAGQVTGFHDLGTASTAYQTVPS
jgi:hypothetical protein